MNSRAPSAAQGVLHNFRQIERVREGRFRPAADNIAGHAASLLLLAIDLEDAGELGRLGLVDEIRRRRAIGSHAHVERTVAHQRESAIGLVHLHRRDAEIEGHAVDRGVAEASVHPRERGLDQFEPSGRFQRRREAPGRGVAIEGDDVGAGVQKTAAIAARAEGAVDHGPPRRGFQRGEHLVQHDRRVGRVRHATATSRRLARSDAHSDLARPRAPAKFARWASADQI
jgi:hypothetical protein